MRIAFDTNVLAYVAGLKRSTADSAKIIEARALVNRLSEEHDLVVATQVLGELFNVMVKGGLERAEAREIADVFADRYTVATSALDQFTDAFALAVDHRLPIWDALILTTSAAAGCVLLLSEDMHDGLTLRGITVANPFAAKPQPKLAAMLRA